MASRRLPKSANLGGGYRIKVKVVPPEEIMQVLHETGRKAGASGGGWDVDTRTIWINETLKPKARWQVYWHEMVHAAVDAQLQEANVL